MSRTRHTILAGGAAALLLWWLLGRGLGRGAPAPDRRLDCTYRFAFDLDRGTGTIALFAGRLTYPDGRTVSIRSDSPRHWASFFANLRSAVALDAASCASPPTIVFVRASTLNDFTAAELTSGFEQIGIVRWEYP